MKKKIQKPFDVKDAQNGATVETKNGCPVRIICYDKVGDLYPIVALIDINHTESCYRYTSKGELYPHTSDKFDLVIVEEVEEPNFNVGDYIVSDIGNIYEITKIDEMYHTKQLSSGYEQRWTIEDIDRSFHKWSLSDAKPGSILCCQDGHPFMFKEICDGYPIAYFGINSLNIIYKSTGHIWTRELIRPATFREYNSLFKQLRKENYEYNVDTHEITKQEIWRNKEDLNTSISGYFISSDSIIYKYDDGIFCKRSYNVFATKKQAKAALAMARISQIMTNDKRFGGIIADEEWVHHENWVILRHNNTLMITSRHAYEYLSFHTREQAELFLKENEDLIKDYYMLD